MQEPVQLDMVLGDSESNPICSKFIPVEFFESGKLLYISNIMNCSSLF